MPSNPFFVPGDDSDLFAPKGGGGGIVRGSGFSGPPAPGFGPSPGFGTVAPGNFFSQGGFGNTYDPRGAGRRRRATMSYGRWNQSPGQTSQTSRPNIQNQAYGWGDMSGAIPGLPQPGTPGTGGIPGSGGGRWDYLTSQLGGIGDTRGAYEGLRDLITFGQGQGAFSPYGDPEQLSAIDDYYQRQGAADEQQAALASDLDNRGGGIFGRGLARTEARAGARNRSADAAMQARLAQMQAMQDFQRRLFAGTVGGDYTMDDDYTRARWAADMAGDERRSANRRLPYEIGGDIAGRAIGAWAGGGG